MNRSRWCKERVTGRRFVVNLTDEEQAGLHELAKKGRLSARKLTRAHILLRADEVAAETIRVVLDNLNTRTPAALCGAYSREEARRITRKLESHHTPKRGSWLNMAEMELAVPTRQRLDQAFPTSAPFARKCARWRHRATPSICRSTGDSPAPVLAANYNVCTQPDQPDGPQVCSCLGPRAASLKARLSLAEHPPYDDVQLPGRVRLCRWPPSKGSADPAEPARVFSTRNLRGRAARHEEPPGTLGSVQLQLSPLRPDQHAGLSKDPRCGWCATVGLAICLSRVILFSTTSRHEGWSEARLRRQSTGTSGTQVA